MKSKSKFSRTQTHKSIIISQSKLVPSIMQQQDVLNLIIEKLEVQQLLLCSMVSKVFLRAIDSSKKSSFNKYLRFWCLSDSLRVAPSWTHDQTQNLVFNRETLQYEQNIPFSHHWQKLWIRNVVPRVGEVVQMRLPLNLTVPFDEHPVSWHESLVLTGKEEHMQKVKKKGNISIDAFEWTIKSITITDHTYENSALLYYGYNAHNATVVMYVTQFLQSNKQINIKLLRSVSVTFTNVPVLHKIRPHRILCVLKCMRFCMHCKQRSVRFETLDDANIQHRLLCSICIDHLYVQRKQLHSKWKIKRSQYGKISANVTEVRFFNTLNWEWKKTNEPYLLKSEVAHLLGYSDWTAFLNTNLALTAKEHFQKFQFCHGWCDVTRSR